MSDQPRKILKINTSGFAQQKSDAPPSALPQSTPKLKLTTKARFAGAPNQESDSIPTPKTTLILKVPQKPKSDASPGSKKRDHDQVDGGSNKPVIASKKKLRLSLVKKVTTAQAEEPQSATVTTPFVRFKVKEKFKKKARQRRKGYAYDSEASDRENEPIQQWNFILRMPPGDDADWIRLLIEKRELEKNKQLLKLRFLQEDGRRAMLTVRNKTYAAILVDLPCIIESMKGWDKKGWYKSADIHQMLLVLGTVTSENEALKHPLPKAEVNDKTWAYAHGLTPPMHWVRKRRFRKRISTHAIQDIEESVKRLIEKDASAIGDVQFDVLDRDALRRQEDMEEEYYEGDDGEGEFDDDFSQNAFGVEAGEEEDVEEEEVDQEAFEAQFESFLAGGEDGLETQDIVQTPGSSSAAALETRLGTDSDMGTPVAVGSKATSDDDDDDDEEDEDDDDDENEDESEKEERVGFQRAREAIGELESAIKEQLAEMERVGNPLLKTRIRNKIQALQADLELKKAAIGDEDDD